VSAEDIDLEAPSKFMRLLGLHFDELTRSRVTGWLDTGVEHHQPWGLVHGGVYAAVIETAATTGAYLTARERRQQAVGICNVTDFLRPHREGRLLVTAEPLHQGRTQQLWQVILRRESDGKDVARGQVRLQHVDIE